MTTEFEQLFKSKLIDTFRFTVEFLNDNKLTWWACYGTAIGAVRHKSIIPWDDDIDICMPREDFDKLSALKYKFEGTPYNLMVMGDDDLFTIESKIVLRESSWQEMEFLHCNTGIYIDVFPLDSLDVDYKQLISLQNENLLINRKYYLSLIRPTFHSLYRSIYKGDFKVFAVQCASWFYPYSKKNQYFEMSIKLLKSFKEYSDGEYYVSFGGADREKEIFKKSWFSDTVEMPFDDFVVKLPVGYDEMLRSIYGNYMQLPPVEKQVSKHEQYYINLSKRLSHSEIRERVKKGYNHEII